ncbi:MAG: type I glyceraldehyde-3-phosphate dehydrogenase [Actinomycetia bacterium]|nr:type I glyceraldehyde-3-phosphate dehydrogenase [Actinomycetes bacterium]
MAIRVGINGFGRIGRLFFRAALREGGIDIVAINDLTDINTLAYLMKYDSIHGILPEEVKIEDDVLIVGNEKAKVFCSSKPSELPWGENDIEVVVESTGRFCYRAGAAEHLSAGARKVIISAPAKEPDITIVLGVNEDKYEPQNHHIISNASCTTNCLGPVVKVLMDNFGMTRGFMTTIHAYTNDQKVLDFPHKDLRRARAAALSIIPTSTGAAKAIGLVIPELKGKMDGMAMRIPVADGSIVDLVAELEKEVTKEDINNAFKNVADQGRFKNILSYVEAPIVSADIIGNSYSSVFDGLCTMAYGKLVKVVSWYDNEWGYSSRLVDLVKFCMK